MTGSVRPAILAGGRARRMGGTTKAALPLAGRSPRGLEPLCAAYARSCADPIRRRLERGRRAASLLPEDVSIVEIGPDTLTAIDPDGLRFMNLNTPHDYERARDLLEAKTRGDRIMDAPEPGDR